MDIINGTPTGCVRISFGYMSTWKDVETFLRFLTECFLGKSIKSLQEIVINGKDTLPVSNNEGSKHGHLLNCYHPPPSSLNGRASEILGTKELPSSDSSVIKCDSLIKVTSEGTFVHDFTCVCSIECTCMYTYYFMYNLLFLDSTTVPKYCLKKILVYPVKSCGGFEVGVAYHR